MTSKNHLGISLEKAIELRQRYPDQEAYEMYCTAKIAWVWDGWMGRDNKVVAEPSQKPARPANYKLLEKHWQLVSVEIAFNGYPPEKIKHLIADEEFYYAPEL